jgi:dihydroorotate dehydrogenase (NAD+) catalytic subunit
VGCVSFRQPNTAVEVIGGIEAYLARHGIGDVRELVGAMTV